MAFGNFLARPVRVRRRGFSALAAGPYGAGANPNTGRFLQLPEKFAGHWRRAMPAAGMGALISAAIAHPETVSDLYDWFSTIHAGLGALVLAGLVCAATTFAGSALALAETMQRVAIGGTVALLPFAQAADPQGAKAGAWEKAVAGARSEIQVGLYGGFSHSPRSDVRLTAPDDTDITLKNIKWKTESLQPAIYYGMRGIDWNARIPALGAMLDFTHAKATAIRSQSVDQTGRRKGETVPRREPFEKTFSKLEFTHGLNFLTLNGVFRATGLNRRIVPYVGLGIGFMIPHADAYRAGTPQEDRVHGARLTGVAYQVLGGFEWRLTGSGWYSALTEYTLAYTTNDVALNDGANVNANIWVHQFNLGGYYTAWRQGAAR